jgi:hypothetical protein
VAVDERQLIGRQAVTWETNDQHQLMPMIRTMERQSGDTLPVLLANAGYGSEASQRAFEVLDASIPSAVHVDGRHFQITRDSGYRSLSSGA